MVPTTCGHFPASTSTPHRATSSDKGNRSPRIFYTSLFSTSKVSNRKSDHLYEIKLSPCLPLAIKGCLTTRDAGLPSSGLSTVPESVVDNASYRAFPASPAPGVTGIVPQSIVCALRPETRHPRVYDHWYGVLVSPELLVPSFNSPLQQPEQLPARSRQLGQPRGIRCTRMGSIFSCGLDDDALDKHELERLAVLHKGVNVHEKFNFVSRADVLLAAL